MRASCSCLCPAALFTCLAGVPGASAEAAGIGRPAPQEGRSTSAEPDTGASRRASASTPRRSIPAHAAEFDRQAAAALAAAALTDGSPRVRAAAARELGDVGDEMSIPLIQPLLFDSEPEVREAAIEAIAGIGGARAAWTLGLALSDVDPDLREAAVYALGRVGGRTAIDVVRPALHDETRIVRAAAAEVLAAEAGNRWGRESYSESRKTTPDP